MYSGRPGSPSLPMPGEPGRRRRRIGQLSGPVWSTDGSCTSCADGATAVVARDTGDNSAASRHPQAGTDPDLWTAIARLLAFVPQVGAGCAGAGHRWPAAAILLECRNLGWPDQLRSRRVGSISSISPARSWATRHADLFKLDTDGTVGAVLQGLCFAGGVTATTDESALVNRQNQSRRLSKYWLGRPSRNDDGYLAVHAGTRTTPTPGQAFGSGSRRYPSSTTAEWLARHR